MLPDCLLHTGDICIIVALILSRLCSSAKVSRGLPVQRDKLRQQQQALVLGLVVKYWLS